MSVLKLCSTSFAPLFTALAVNLLGVGGCGGGDDDADGGLPETTIAAFVGTYRVTAHTVNDSGCDVEGPSVLESMKDTHFVLAERVVLGERFLDLASCKDDVDCASKATAIREGKPFALEFSFSFTSRESEDVLGGMAAGGGGIGASEGMCARSYSEHRLSMREDGSVRLESRTTALPETPAHDNQCWFEPAAMKREAQGRPCTELTVIEATPAP